MFRSLFLPSRGIKHSGSHCNLLRSDPVSVRIRFWRSLPVRKPETRTKRATAEIRTLRRRLQVGLKLICINLLDVIKATTAVIYGRITTTTHSLCYKTFLRPYIRLAEPSSGVNTRLNLRHCQWRMAYGVRRKAPSFYNIDLVGTGRTEAGIKLERSAKVVGYLCSRLKLV